MTTYRYLTAAQWGGKWARPPVSESLSDPEAYVHHVAGQAWMDGTAEQVFQSLNAYATRPKAEGGKGYSYLDYDCLVHLDRKADVVTIGEGRGPYRSAATLDRNEEGEAIVLCANTDQREPTPQELEGLALGIVWMMDKGWVASTARILGHRDNPAHPNATACPGKYLYPKLPEIRVRVAELLGKPLPPDPGGKPDPPDPGDDMDAKQALQLDQVHTIMAGAFWPNAPEITNVMGGELAERIRRIEDKLDRLLEA